MKIRNKFASVYDERMNARNNFAVQKAFKTL